MSSTIYTYSSFPPNSSTAFSNCTLFNLCNWNPAFNRPETSVNPSISPLLLISPVNKLYCKEIRHLLFAAGFISSSWQISCSTRSNSLITHCPCLASSASSDASVVYMLPRTPTPYLSTPAFLAAMTLPTASVNLCTYRSMKWGFEWFNGK